MDVLNEWLEKHRIIGLVANGREYDMPTERIVCRDGYSFSCQANRTAYCNPRESGAYPYSSVELGFPNDRDKLIDIYAEDPKAEKDEDGDIAIVYGYVPVQTVIKLIKKHGGFKDGPSKADIDILEAGYELIGPGADGHLTYLKHINDHKMRVIDISKKDYRVACYSKHIIGSSKIASMTKAEKRLFNAKLEEMGKESRRDAILKMDPDVRFDKCNGCPYHYSEPNLCMYGEKEIPDDWEKKCEE